MDCAHHGPVFMTDRLFIRPVELGDAATTAALMSPAIARNLMTWSGAMSVTDARQRIARSRREAEAGRWINWAVFSKDDLILLGWVGIGRSDLDASRRVVGFWIGEAFHGRGFATEAMTAVLDRAANMLGGGGIDAYVLPGNTAGERVLRKLGFTEHGRQRRYVDARVRWEDFVHFARPSSFIGATGGRAMAVTSISALSVLRVAVPGPRQAQ